MKTSSIFLVVGSVALASMLISGCSAPPTRPISPVSSQAQYYKKLPPNNPIPTALPLKKHARALPLTRVSYKSPQRHAYQTQRRPSTYQALPLVSKASYSQRHTAAPRQPVNHAKASNARQTLTRAQYHARYQQNQQAARQAKARRQAHQQTQLAAARQAHYQARPQHAFRQQAIRPQIQRATFSRPVNRSVAHWQPAQGSSWTRVFNSFRLPDYSRYPQVQRFIRSYARNPGQLSILSSRADTFLHMIIEEVNRRGIPAEIALLPFVESGFNLDVFSHAGAAGLWQFIPSTGRSYGLTQTRHYDARMDPFAATGAALTYLQKLNRTFNGDWLLALAAYNCGQGCVSRAIRKARSLGRPTDYWNLSLPRETMNYVPRLMAFKELIKNHRRYGIRLPNTPNHAKLTQVRFNQAVDLRQVALSAGLPANTLTRLNPCFRTGVTTPQYSNRIILPRVHAARLVQAINQHAARQYGQYSRRPYRGG